MRNKEKEQKKWAEFKVDESFLKKTPIENKYTVAILYYLIAFLLINAIGYPLAKGIFLVLEMITDSILVLRAASVSVGLTFLVLYFKSIYRLIHFLIKRIKISFQKTKKKKSQKIIINNQLNSDFIEPLMSSDEALSKLKKSKEKLDLELITQKDYDKIKEELKKYIS